MQIKPNQAKYVQLGLEMAIPIAGIIWWNWTFYFILLFYLLDYCAFIVTGFYKDRKIQQFQLGTYSFPLKQFALTFSLLIVSIIIFYLFLQQLELPFKTATLDFIFYEDMGIAQGYVLIPLVILTAFMAFKTEFILPKKYAVLSIQSIWKEMMKLQAVVILGGIVLFALSFFDIRSDIIYNLLFLSTILLYKLVEIKRTQNN